MFKSFKTVGAADSTSANDTSTMDTTATSPWGLPEEETPMPLSNNTFAPVATPAPISTPSYNAPRNTRNVLNSDVEVKGTLTFTDDLLVDGIVEGEITSDGSLTIGTKADIQAEIKTSSVTIHGRVHGNITVTGEAALMSTAEVIGDITAATLSVQSGAIFIGRSCMPQSGKTGATTPSIPSKKSVVKDNDLL